MRDVGKRAAVDKRRGSFQRLDQIRLKSVFEQSCHSADCFEIAGCDRFVIKGIADDNAGQPLLQIGDRACQTEDCHNLAGNGDVKAIFARHTVEPAAETVGDETKLAVVHIDAALPCDLAHVNAERVTLLNVVVEHSCKQVVRGADGVEVAGEMQIDVFHRDNLRIAAAGSAALDTEHGAKRRFAQRNCDVLADFGQAVGKTDRCGSLTLARRCRRDGGYKHKLAVRTVGVLEKLRIDLCFVLAVLFDICFVDVCFFCNFGDGLHFALLCDFDIG